MSFPPSGVRRLIGAAVLLLAAAAVAQERPASREEANAAVDQARRDTAEVKRRYEQAQRDCATEIFVNACREQARKERDQRLRAIRESEVAARETLRRLDAEGRAQARAQRSAEQAVVPKAGGGAAPKGRETTTGRAGPPAAVPRPKDPTEQEAEAAKKQAEAAARQAEAQRRAAAEAAQRERREEQRTEKAAREATEIERYEDRQRAAQARAEEKRKVAEENRQRREKRAQDRGAVPKGGDSGSPPPQ